MDHDGPRFDPAALWRMFAAVHLQPAAHDCAPVYPAGGTFGVCSVCGTLTVRPLAGTRVPRP